MNQPKYAERGFPREDLREMVWGDYESPYIIIEDKITGTSRWNVQHSMIFQFEDKFYRTSYSVGATEMQDEYPFEHDGEIVMCTEVEPFPVTITKYKAIEVNG